MLSIQIESTLLEPQGLFLPEEILVAYKQAAVTIGDQTFCSSAGDGYSPKVGDQLIYFFFGIPSDTTGRLSMPYYRQLVFADPKGQLVARERSLEEKMLGDGTSTLDQFVKTIVEALNANSMLFSPSTSHNQPTSNSTTESRLRHRGKTSTYIADYQDA